MKKILLAALVAGAFAAGANAQESNELPKPDLTGETLDQPTDIEALKAQAVNNIGKDGKAQWYVRMDYGGFDFELPAGLIVDKGSSLTAKCPDGTFGLSMSNQEVKGANQKEAYELCRRQVSELRLTNAKVERMNFGKCSGAIAKGTMEGTEVTMIVLPNGNKQVNVVMFNTAAHQDWADHFIETLKR